MSKLIPDEAIEELIKDILTTKPEEFVGLPTDEELKNSKAIEAYEENEND